MSTKYFNGRQIDNTSDLVICAIFIGYRLKIAKYARPRSLSRTANRACEDLEMFAIF